MLLLQAAHVVRRVIARVDPPQEVGERLAHVSQDDRELGEAVEESAEEQSQEVRGVVRAPPPQRALHHGIIAEDPRLDVYRYAELDDALPEGLVAFVVEVDAVRVAVDHRPEEAELLDAPLQLVA